MPDWCSQEAQNRQRCRDVLQRGSKPENRQGVWRCAGWPPAGSVAISRQRDRGVPRVAINRQRVSGVLQRAADDLPAQAMRAKHKLELEADIRAYIHLLIESLHCTPVLYLMLLWTAACRKTALSAVGIRWYGKKDAEKKGAKADILSPM
eukprot:1151475-Pelagomonas_calceolata.AAC.1